MAESRQTSHCKACGAKLRWVVTRQGRHMPCQAEREIFWIAPQAPGPEITIITDTGDVVKGRQGSIITEGATQYHGFVVHWGVCPSPDQFRKGRR